MRHPQPSRLIAPVVLVCSWSIVPAGPGLAQDPQDHKTLDAVQAELSDAFAAIGTYSAAQRDAALSQMQKTLAALDDRIDETEARIRDEWAEMSEATQDRTAAALRALRDRRNRLSETYGALSQGAATAWGDLMAGLSTGWSDLEAAWDEAASALSDTTETGKSDEK